MNILTDVALAPLTTFQMGGIARYFVSVSSESDLLDILKFSDKEDLPIYILGGGSNTIFSDTIHEKLIVKVEISEFQVFNSKKDVIIKAGAGENWDQLVKQTIEMSFSGMEALSGIPGTVGATPVQNVGAYGQEVSNLITAVRAYDKEEKRFRDLKPNDCNFSYRNSRFKREPKRFIITRVTYRLSHKPPKIPDYHDVRKYFAERKNDNPTLRQIRQAILEIRSRKLPYLGQVPNAGSFFQNPIISQAQYQHLQSRFPDIPGYRVEKGDMKVPAGWLIDQVGLKGAKVGKLETWQDNALVLTNPNKASFTDLKKAVREIKQKVYQKYKITLEPEPRIVE